MFIPEIFPAIMARIRIATTAVNYSSKDGDIPSNKIGYATADVRSVRC
jgi:hypothetical protein